MLVLFLLYFFFFFFKQKTAYEMRISDWSSDVCSSDLLLASPQQAFIAKSTNNPCPRLRALLLLTNVAPLLVPPPAGALPWLRPPLFLPSPGRSDEHTSVLQSLMRISYAVFCLKKQRQTEHNANHASSHQMHTFCDAAY